MHPFCCVSSTIPDPMTPPPPPTPPPLPPAPASASPDHINHNDYSIKHGKVNNNHINNSTENNGNNNQIPSPYFSPPRLSRASQPPSRRDIAQLTAAAAAAAAASGSTSGAAKINDIVGNGISGILYKWVNYGKGWRPRWFVLQDGVLSYYKIHGPDKIVLSQENEKGSRVIGEESFKRISRRSALPSSSQHKTRKPFGEIHLKVCNLDLGYSLLILI